MYHSHRAGPVLQEFGLVLRVGVRHSTSALCSGPCLGVKGGCVSCENWGDVTIPAYMPTIRTHRIAENPEKSDLVNFRGPD